MFFSARKLKELMTTQPFHPLKVRLSDGTSYNVPNHDAAFVI